ncbi:dynamin family protein [Turicimonas muris]|uniref:dynamin family protein n=1 Tax=Turicimonas muris TaxID=1796652 RepID=UPI00261493DA|nr:dynamin family protein [Turicimonas muris]
MNIIPIMLLTVIVILTLLLLIICFKRHKGNNKELNELIQEYRKKIEEVHKDYQSQIDAIEKQHQNIEKQTNDKLQAITEKFTEIEKLRANELEKAALRIATLEKEIAQAIEVGADDAIKARLAEAKELSLKVNGLEHELKLAKDSALASEKLQSKVDELSKQVNSLEEQLEETEEEAEEAQKRRKKIQTAYSQLQEELDKTEKEAKHYLQKFNQTQNNLKHLQKELDIREEALDFVTEVLTAERTNDESVSMLYKNVDSTVDFITGELRECLKSTNNLPISIKNKYFGQALTAWAINKKKTWIQGKITIAFVGEFSAGKTSIVNRLLSQDNPDVPQLPVSTKATTAIPTYITGGISTFYQFVSPNNELKRISPKTFKRVSKEILEQVKGVSSLIQYFVMTYENPHLEKMSILDTPGFNSNDSEDAERTIEVINECDALFWIFDVNAGTVNRASLKIIKEHLKKPLYIVINQIDTKSKSDVDDVETLIRKTLMDEGIIFCGIIRFSKNEPLDIMMDPIHKINRDNSREALLDNLLEYMRNKVKDAKNATKAALQDSNEKEENLTELTNQFGEKLTKLIDDCERVKEIPQFNSRWFSADDYRISQEQFNEFGNLLDEIGNECTLKLNDLFDEQKDVVSELETAWQKHQKAKSQQKKLQDCLDKLEKKKRMLSEARN